MAMGHKHSLKSLFISYDGQAHGYFLTLFLSPLRRLSSSGIRFHTLTVGVKKGDTAKTTDPEIPGISFRYHSSFPGMIWNLLRMIFAALFLVGTKQIQIIHVRSYVPGLVALTLRRFISGIKIIFDTDGLMPDERIDFKIWKKTSLIYKFFLKAEKQLILHSKVVITKTNRQREILKERHKLEAETLRKFYTLPNGKDEQLFRPLSPEAVEVTRQNLGVSLEAPLVVLSGDYIRYDLEAALRFFKFLTEKRSDSRFLLLSNHPALFFEQADRLKIDRKHLITDYVDPEKVPALIAAADLGFAVSKSFPSLHAVFPIKFSEYLLCGVPLVLNGKMGDVDSLFQKTPEIAYLWDGETEASLMQGVDWFLKEVLPNREKIRAECRQRGGKDFSLKMMVRKYQEIYSQL